MNKSIETAISILVFCLVTSTLFSLQYIDKEYFWLLLLAGTCVFFIAICILWIILSWIIELSWGDKWE